MSKYLNEYSGNTLAEQMVRFEEQRAAARKGRRNFLAGLAAAGAATTALGMAGCSDAGQLQPVSTSAPSASDVLQFALNLEYLEASFYLFVSTGNGLSSADQGSGAGAVSGGAKVNFQNAVVASVASQLATDEQEHVEFLRSTLQSLQITPIAMPAIDLTAGGTVTVNNDATFLAAARRLEAVGVSAYIGGAQYLVSNTTALQYAAQILDTEAQHAGFVRELCIALGVTSPAVDSMDMPPTSSQIFNTSPTTGLNPVRTTSQVLQIVYGTTATGVTKGGFFPNGLNGSILST